jgi:hypothetical protein
MLLIIVEDVDRWGDQPLHEAILRTLLKLGVAGATAWTGMAGYGAGGRLHHRGLFGVSDEKPLLIAAIDTEEKLRAVAPSIVPMDSVTSLKRITFSTLAYPTFLDERTVFYTSREADRSGPSSETVYQPRFPVKPHLAVAISACRGPSDNGQVVRFKLRMMRYHQSLSLWARVG